MELKDVLKKFGFNPAAKKAYQRLFKKGSGDSRLVLDDLMIRFRFYGAVPTNEAIALAKQAAYREVIEYILTMSARISDDTVEEIEKFINR